MNIDILGLGECVVDWVAIVDHFPSPDEKIDSISQSLFSGGVTANYIVAAARLGIQTGFMGAVGKDEQGVFLKEDFIKKNVNIDYFISKENQKTPVNFIFVVQDTGEKVIIQSPYMHTTIPEISDLNEDAFNGVKVLHTTGIYPEITLKAFEIAKSQDTIISFDLEKQIAIRGVAQLKPLLDQVDILMPNKAGAMELTNTSTPIDAAKVFLDWGIKTIVITLGAEGAMVVTNEKIIKVPAMEIKPVDTTGAGDTFCAAFDYAHFIRGLDLNDACLFANAAAGLKIQKLGARTGMPSLEEVMDFLAVNNINLQQDL